MIRKEKLFFAFICTVVFSICLIGGFFFKPLFILAAISLAGYVWIDKRYLRCPDCGGFENLERLYYAKSHIYHCRHCGQIIKVG